MIGIRTPIPRVILAILCVVLALVMSAAICEDDDEDTDSDPVREDDPYEDAGMEQEELERIQALQEAAAGRASGPPKAPVGPGEDVPELPPASAPEPAAAPPSSEVQNFAGSWHSAPICDHESPYHWQITINQQSGSDDVTGTLSFHACPSGGSATYSLAGRATNSDTLFLQGTKTGGRGDLSGSAPATQTFQINRNSAPFPNFAP